MTVQTLQTERIAVSFGDSPLVVRAVRNRLTRERLAGLSELSVLIRLPERISDPIFLTEVESLVISNGVLQARLADPSGSFTVELQAKPGPEGIVFSFSARALQPIWMVEWKITGLDCDQLILPALGGQSLSKRMPPATTLSYKYPFWWNAQFVTGQSRKGGLVLHTRGPNPKFKLVRVSREDERFSLSVGFEVDAPLGAQWLEGRWALDCYRGPWKAAADQHRAWMEQEFSLRRLTVPGDTPAWLQVINFVLELWGMAKDRPTPLHTFSQMEVRLKRFAKLHDPHATLVYLPGFAEHGIDSRAPSYNPSPYLGGDEGFRSLIATAHRLGYRVMIHTNVLCMTFDHPLFQAFKDHQVRDPWDRLQGWGLDIDGDWLPEPYFAYINPGVREWGDLMEKVIGDLVSRFDIDGVFLDQTLLAFNSTRGPDFVTGMREHVLRLRRAFPSVLFAGEGYHERVAQALPMAQIHGIDSIAEVHGMEGRVPWRKAHPVSTYLFGPFVRFTGHLLTRHPSHPMFAVQESAYDQLDVIPVLSLYNNRQSMDMPEVRRMLRRAQRFGRTRQ